MKKKFTLKKLKRNPCYLIGIRRLFHSDGPIHPLLICPYIYSRKRKYNCFPIWFCLAARMKPLLPLADN